jgi:hypothetical protein
MRDDLDISYKDKQLEDPYVTTIEIANVGRAPILGDDYTQKRALQFQLASPIITVLSVEHRPESAPQPTIASAGNNFELKPELLVKDEVIRASLLTEGQPGDVKVSLNPFGAIEVQVRDRAAWLAQRNKRRGIGAIIGLTSLTAVLVALITITAVSANNDYSVAKGAISQSYCTDLIGDVSGAQLAISLTKESVIVTKNKSGFVTAIKPVDPIFSSELRTAQSQVNLLAGDYAAAAEAGVSLGSAAQVPVAAKEAVEALTQLPQEGASITAQNGLTLANKESNLLLSQQVIPAQCRQFSKS